MTDVQDKKIKHRGQFVREKARELRVTMPVLSKRMSRSLGALYRDFNDPRLSFDRIYAFGKALRFDFSEDFPELKNYKPVQEDQESIAVLSEVSRWKDEAYFNLKKAEEWKDKYIELLEKWEGKTGR